MRRHAQGVLGHHRASAMASVDWLNTTHEMAGSVLAMNHDAVYLLASILLVLRGVHSHG